MGVGTSENPDKREALSSMLTSGHTSFKMTVVSEPIAAKATKKLSVWRSVSEPLLFAVDVNLGSVGRVVTRSPLEREVLRFKSRACQIGHSVANGSPSLQHFLERSCVARRCNGAEMGPASSLHALA